jgi:phospholipid/cholesterol/gamma-HCH transport system substrate-binding protein
MARKTAVVTALGLLAAMGGTLLVVKSIRSRYVEIRAYTDDASGLDEGTSVRLNGISIGELDKIVLTNSRDPKRKILFVMKVRTRHLPEIPRDSLVGVAATNLLGNYFLDILRGQSSQPVAPGGELQTTQAADPSRLLAQMSNEFQGIQAIVDRANKLLAGVDAGHGNIGMWQKHGVDKLNGVSAEFNQVTDDIRSSHGSLGKLGELSAQMESSQKRLDDLIAGFQAGQGTAGKLQALSEEIREMSTEASRLTADFSSDQGPGKRLTKLQDRMDLLRERFQSALDRSSSGQGTLGQLSVNPQLSEALAGAGTQFQTLAQDLKANPRKFLSFQLRLF